MRAVQAVFPCTAVPQPWFFLGLCAYDGYRQLIPRCFTEWLITSLAGVLLECLLFDFLIMRLTTNKPTIISFVEHKFNQCSTSLLLKIWEFCKVYTSSSIEKLMKQKLHTKVFLKLAFLLVYVIYDNRFHSVILVHVIIFFDHIHLITLLCPFHLYTSSFNQPLSVFVSVSLLFLCMSLSLCCDINQDCVQKHW